MFYLGSAPCIYHLSLSVYLEDWTAARGKKWDEIKRSKVEAKRHKNINYYKIKLGSHFMWFSQDTAGHGGSAFKGWTDKKAEIVFDSSYDVNLKRMTGKHDSNAGKKIKKSEMNAIR